MLAPAVALQRHWPVLLPLLISCFVFRAWLVPSLPIAGDDFPPFAESIIRGDAFGWPHLWTNLQFGWSITYWAACAPLWALAAPLHAAGASFAVIERILWLWPYMLGAPLCGYYLCYSFTRNRYAAAVGAALFAINTWSVGLVERGHIPSLEAFMLSGIALPRTLGFAQRPTLLAALGLAILVSLQFVFDVRYAYESIVVLALVTAFNLRRLSRHRRLAAMLRAAVAFGLAMALLNLDFLMPAFLVGRTPAEWGSVQSFLDASHYGSLLGAFSLYFPFYHYVVGSDGFAQTNVELPFLLVALVAWVGLLLNRHRPTSRIFMAIAFLGILLVSAATSIFSSLNVAIYEHVPGVSLFRDFSKFNGLIVPAYAVGVAFAVVAFFGVLRLRAPRLAHVGGVASLALCLAYLFVVRDSLNPLRHSNFARAASFTDAGDATERFLQSNLGDANVLMFPGDVRSQRRQAFIASADATTIAGSPPPDGLALLNPALVSPDPLFQMFGSPLSPAMLREFRVKYVVVPDDRVLYYLFNGRAQRWAATDFLHQQRWLHEVARFGDNVVFQLNEPPVERAFFAPYPTLVIGSPATMEGLVGSPLWDEHAAALVSAQMPDGADWLSSLPNVVEGPTLIDPDFPVGLKGPVAAAQRLAETVTAERYRRRPFSARVFSSAMLTKSLLGWNFDSPFAFRFGTTQTDRAKLSLLLERRKTIPSVLIRNSGNVYAGATATSGTIEASAIACSEAQVWTGQLSAETISVPATDAGKEVFVNNPCPVAYEGTVAFRVASQDPLPLPLSVTYGNITRTFSAPPVWLSPLGFGTVNLSDIVLRPGLNLFQFNKSAKRAFSIIKDYTFSDVHALSESFRPYPLDLTVKRSQSGDLVYASIAIPRSGMHVGYLDLFGPLQLPLDEHPACTLKYTLSNVPGAFDLVLDLRNRTTGKSLSFWIPIEQKQDADYDLYELVRAALSLRFQNEVAYHIGDPLWTAQHFAQSVPSPDDYTLRSLKIATMWSVFESSDVPHGTFVALFRGIRLATNTSSIGTEWAYPQTRRIDTAGVSEKNFTLRGMKILRIDNAQGSEPRIGAQLSGFIPNGYRLATALHVGDFVQLALQSGQRVQGTIVAESSDYILIQDGDNPPQRIARGSISTVAQQQITPSAKLDIPIDAPFTPTRFSFDVRSDEGLRIRIALVYQAQDGSRETIPAVDREDTDLSGIDVEPAFVKPALLTGGTIFDLSIPIDLALAQQPLQRLTNYDIDLWDVERYRFGGSRHRLVGFTIDFTDTQNAGAVGRQFSIAISNLEVSRDRLLHGDASASAVGQPLLDLDGRPITARAPTKLPESTYFAGDQSLGMLLAGNHVIESRPLDEVKIRAATVSFGSPTPYYGGRVSSLTESTPSELTGSFDGAGVLVVPHTYDAGWVLATWPSGSALPAFTGFALLDWLRCFGHMRPQTDHVPANTNMDAWYIPPTLGGEQRFMLLYSPEALNELGFITTCAALFVGLLWWSVTRRSTGQR